MPPVFVSIVLDGVGCGAQADASTYGDVGANTLAHVCRDGRPDLPHLTRLGLGRILDLEGVPPVDRPEAHFGLMTETSAGKDSTTGHWELAGIQLLRPFPTYPDGFPVDLIESFVREVNVPGVLGNRPASGTAVIQELGDLHRASGCPIVYTSADSVFQVAAHEDVYPTEALYEMCRVARERVCVGPHGVGRVIARPFLGVSGDYRRESAGRRDYARKPEQPPLQLRLQEASIQTVCVGKVSDLFGGVGFDRVYKTGSNADGLDYLEGLLDETGDRPRFVWANLIDFDQEFGHRNDVEGFARSLEAFDQRLPDLLSRIGSEDRLFITADHGNDPTFPGTDHTREYVPVLYYEPGIGVGRSLGRRTTFADHAATVLAFFGLDALAGEAM